MGIERFSGKYVTKVFPDCVVKNVPNDVSTLVIDMNSVIHTAVAEVYCSSDDASDCRTALRELLENGQLSDEELMNRAFQRICDEIKVYLELFQPSDFLGIYVDGPT